MDIEFHYYITKIVALRAGFSKNDAEKIAYSSQYVDDNDICFIVNKGKEGEYGNFISQTMDILKPKQELLRIYPIFHFVPGDPLADTANRKDGKLHLLNTTPNNDIATELLESAFTSKKRIRLYQIGVATHAYVDTWAHQNFVGWCDEYNAIKGNLLPDIGHAEAEHNPDYPAHLWKDSRLVSEHAKINNLERFLDAAKHLFAHYKAYLNNNGTSSDVEWATVKKEIKKAVGFFGISHTAKAARVKRYKETIKEISGNSDVEDYNETSWYRAAVNINVRGLKDFETGWVREYFNFFKDKYSWKNLDTYKTSDWYLFQEAVKNHERTALDIGRFTKKFDKMGIELHSE